MKTRMKKLVALLLVVAMTVALASFSVLAAPAAPSIKGYTIIGDSITSGYTVDKEGTWDANLQPVDIDYGILADLVPCPETNYSVQDIEGLRKISGGTTYRVHRSYSDLVANYLGITMQDDSLASYANLEKDGYYNLSLPGLRSGEVRMMVDPTYGGDDISGTIWEIVQKPGLDVLKQKTREYIANSDVLTINIGSNDVAVNCFIRALKVIDAAGADTQALNYIRAAVAVGDYVTATSYLFEAAKLLGVFPLAAAAYLQGLASGALTFFENWDPIISNILAINPNIKIYVVGFYNPFRDFHITDLGDEIWLRIGHLLDALLQSMNLYITSAATTRDSYEFVDVFNIEVIGMGALIPGLIDGSYFKYILYDVHPTTAGHQQIADAVIAKMKEVPPTPVNPEPDPSEPVAPSRYTDVPDGEWCKIFVDYVSDRGIMTGVTPTTFEPYSNLTRAQVATILYALEGKPANSSNAFTDVAPTSWYFDPVNWCATNGIVAGIGDGTFAPNRDVTREELATMLRSYAAYFNGDVESAADITTFADAADVSPYAVQPVQWAVAKDLISGRPGNLLAPKGKASRAEMAVIMMNFCNTYGK